MISIAALICAADLQKLLVASRWPRALFATHTKQSNIHALFDVAREPQVTQVSFNHEATNKLRCLPRGVLGGFGPMREATRTCDRPASGHDAETRRGIGVAVS